MQRWTLHVEGKVQGVFYRKSTAEQATELGLTGFVRNLSDGSVHIVAEGSDAQLEALERWCWEGPKQARVTKVNVERSVAEGEFATFEVRK